MWLICCRVGFGHCRNMLSRLPLTRFSILVRFLFRACTRVSALHIWAGGEMTRKEVGGQASNLLSNSIMRSMTREPAAQEH